MRFATDLSWPTISDLGNSKVTRNYAVQRGTSATRVVGAIDGSRAAVLSAKSTGGYKGRRGNGVYTVLQRINATPRYVLQFFESDGTQIGSTIVVNGSDLLTVASTLVSNANGTHFSMSVLNNANQATDDTGNGFSNAVKMSGGA